MAVQIGTLGEGRDFIISLPEERRSDPDWRLAGQVLLEAAYRNRRAPLQDVRAQLSRALSADGLISSAHQDASNARLTLSEATAAISRPRH